MIILILISAAAVGLFFVNRHPQNNNRWLSWIGFLGSILALSAFFLLPWVELGGVEVFRHNIGWVASNFNTLDSLLIRISLPPTSISSDTLILALRDQVTCMFLSLIQKGGDFHAWQLMQAAFRVHPPLVMALGLSFLITLLSAVVDFGRLLTGDPEWHSSIRRYLPLCNIVLILLLLSYLPFLDSLGTPGNFKIRVLAALAAAKVGCAPWWMIVGMLVSVLGGMRDWIFANESTVVDIQWDWTASQHY